MVYVFVNQDFERYKKFRPDFKKGIPELYGGKRSMKRAPIKFIKDNAVAIVTAIITAVIGSIIKLLLSGFLAWILFFFVCVLAICCWVLFATEPSPIVGAGRSKSFERGHRQIAKWVGGVAIFAIFALIFSLFLFSEDAPPSFKLASQFVRPDSGIVIIAQNKEARRATALDVEIDEIMFEQGGELQSREEPRWHFSLRERSDVPAEWIRDGEHYIRVRFPGEELSPPIKVIFNSKPPIVETEIITQDGRHIIQGRAASRSQHPADTITVDIIFHYDGYPQHIPIPVKRVVSEKGQIFFKFETPVQGLPEYSPEDAQYAAPFFGLRIMDQAGNTYYQVETYAQFMAPGRKRFGVGNLADFEVQQVRESDQITIQFTLDPHQYITELPNGGPPIVLNVTSQARNVKQLEWTNLPDSIRIGRPLTIILRDEEQIAVSAGNQYIDREAPDTSITRYQVRQVGRDGVYGSNIATEDGSDIATENSSTFFPIQLKQGWNLIAYLPREPMPVDKALASIIPHLEEIRDADGQVYEPDSKTNTIWDMQPGQAYLVNLKQATTLIYSRGNVVESSTPFPPIQLSAGWNYVAYLPERSMPIDQALASIAARLVVVKDEEGQMYYPALGLNTIGEMEPGWGYKINVDQATTLTYPAND